MIGTDINGRTIEQQRFGSTALVFETGPKTVGVAGAHNREIETRLRTVVEEEAVFDLADCCGPTEQLSGETEDSFDIRDLLLDELDILEDFEAADAVLVPGGAAEDQWLDEDVFSYDTELRGEPMYEALSDVPFTRESLRLRGILINSSEDKSGPVATGQRMDELVLLRSVPDGGRVDRRLALAAGN